MMEKVIGISEVKVFHSKKLAMEELKRLEPVKKVVRKLGKEEYLRGLKHVPVQRKEGVSGGIFLGRF